MESVYVKVQNTIHERNNTTCNTNGKHRTAATPYALEIRMVRFRHIIVNSLHEGDNKDQNNKWRITFQA